jgi:hypothetical protein
LGETNQSPKVALEKIELVFYNIRAGRKRHDGKEDK